MPSDVLGWHTIFSASDVAVWLQMLQDAFRRSRMTSDVAGWLQMLHGDFRCRRVTLWLKQTSQISVQIHSNSGVSSNLPHHLHRLLGPCSLSVFTTWLGKQQYLHLDWHSCAAFVFWNRCVAVPNRVSTVILYSFYKWWSYNRMILVLSCTAWLSPVSRHTSSTVAWKHWVQMSFIPSIRPWSLSWSYDGHVSARGSAFL